MAVMLSLSAGGSVDSELNIKRSRFICYLVRAHSEDEARTFIETIRHQHPTARHHCTAFRYIEDGDIRERSSDDGEPAGTAGRPMLAVLKGMNIVNVCAVVVRYFGGVKLGTGGLVRAYSDAVTHTYTEAQIMGRIVKRVPTRLWTVECSIANSGRWESELRGRYDVVGVNYGQNSNGDNDPNRVLIMIATQSDDQIIALKADVAALSQGSVEMTEISTVNREYRV